MGLEEVRKEILSSAKAKAKGILKEGEQEVEGINSSIEMRLKDRQAQLKQDMERSIRDFEERASAETASLVRKRRLSLEKEMIEESFSKAYSQLTKMDLKKREKLTLALFEKASKDFKFARLYCAKEDLKLLKKHNPIETDISGGIVLENEDGSVRLDLSFESLLESIKEDSMPSISKTLFG
jgi:V/A-type H+/Na+-transporting ATPase subunit E